MRFWERTLRDKGEKKMKYMTVKIGDFEVEIKAKQGENQKGNAEDTKSFLNVISSALWESSLKNDKEGFKVIAECHRDMANDIYDYLDEFGFYDDVKVY
jgi:hypothetical protein